jgi:hypothetical protein
VTELSVEVEATLAFPAASKAAPAGTVTLTIPSAVRPLTEMV